MTRVGMEEAVTHARRANPPGFTLVELMIVVAIIGILSSVAIPSFRNYGYRSRQTERTMVLRSLKTAVDDYYSREGVYPTNWGGGSSFLNLLNANPDWNPGTSKRAWRRGVPDWNKLPFELEGAVYYTYYGYGIADPGYRFLLLYTAGNLDGDSRQDVFYKVYQYNGLKMEKYNWGGQYACDDCTYAVRLPYPSTTF